MDENQMQGHSALARCQYSIALNSFSRLAFTSSNAWSICKLELDYVSTNGSLARVYNTSAREGEGVEWEKGGKRTENKVVKASMSVH